MVIVTYNVGMSVIYKPEDLGCMHKQGEGAVKDLRVYKLHRHLGTYV